MICPQCNHETDGTASFCGQCGALLATPPPVEPPPGSLYPWNAEKEAVLPTDFDPPGDLTFTGLLKTTFALFSHQIAMIAKIVLVVWIPVDALKNLLLHKAGMQFAIGTIIRINQLTDLIFGSLVVPALIYGLMIALRENRSVSLSEAYRWGLRFWGRIVAVRFLGGLFVLIGFLLLIVPGFVVWSWYLLVDSVVAIEGEDGIKALNRSRELTKGHRLKLIGSFLSILLGALIFGILFGATTEISHWTIDTAVDGLGQLFVSLTTIFTMLAFLHLVKEEAKPGLAAGFSLMQAPVDMKHQSESLPKAPSESGPD